MKPNSIKLMLELPMPAPVPRPIQKREPKEDRPRIEDAVREALECIDSGHDSDVEWLLVNRVYKDLCKLKKPSPRAENLKKMIEPTLSKFGYHGITSNK